MTVKRSEPRNALQPRGELSYPHDFDGVDGVKFAKGHFALDGFVYDRIDGAQDLKTCLKWIDRQYRSGPDKTNFRSQPYLQLAKFLREAGKNRDACHVLSAMERYRPRRGRFSKAWGLVQRAVIGYGYRVEHSYG